MILSQMTQIRNIISTIFSVWLLAMVPLVKPAC